jgi:hypothetical protein
VFLRRFFLGLLNLVAITASSVIHAPAIASATDAFPRAAVAVTAMNAKTKEDIRIASFLLTCTSPQQVSKILYYV